ncbi:DNA cytosine methyltransferase [Shewanella sp. 202IG2-18]|nr:DNA cytosine methyltransferase [Parashewanella hymeniacidonis]
MGNQLTAIDLFSGAGGFSLAAHQNGFDILAAVEFDKMAAKTYSTNIVQRLGAKTQVFNQDINDVDVHGLMKYWDIKEGELDLLLGGPPCQGFSTHRINDAGKEDPRNKLLIRYFDFVKALRPKVFLVENVPGLLWKRHESYLNDFMSLAAQHNYKTISGAPLIINAKDYGVPQNRKRAFILAVREDIISDENMWPPEPTHFSPKEGKTSWLTASTVFEQPPKSILSKLVRRYKELNDWCLSDSELFVSNLVFGKRISEGDPCSVHMIHSDSVAERFKLTPLNGSREDINFRLKCHENGYKGHKDVYGRILFHTPSNTITTGCNNPSKGRFVHPWLNHGITLRHSARLQSFPDEFIFLGSSTEQARQIGNAVPVKLGSALIEQIKKHFLNSSSKNMA